MQYYLIFFTVSMHMQHAQKQLLSYRYLYYICSSSSLISKFVNFHKHFLLIKVRIRYYLLLNNIQVFCLALIYSRSQYYFFLTWISNSTNFFSSITVFLCYFWKLPLKNYNNMTLLYLVEMFSKSKFMQKILVASVAHFQHGHFYPTAWYLVIYLNDSYISEPTKLFYIHFFLEWEIFHKGFFLTHLKFYEICCRY